MKIFKKCHQSTFCLPNKLLCKVLCLCLFILISLSIYLLRKEFHVQLVIYKRSHQLQKNDLNTFTPWFLSNTTYIAAPIRNNVFWPEQETSDRIINQLLFRPSNIQNSSLKIISLDTGIPEFQALGTRVFEQCPVNQCSLVYRNFEIADAIITRNPKTLTRYKPGQIIIAYILECPLHTSNFHQVSHVNWSATYRSDSDIVTPYGKWMYFNPNQMTNPKQHHNYALCKTKNVAWFVSNCVGFRLNYANELAKYIDVDIYGGCGTKLCSRADQNKCFTMLKQDYRFYLSFENSLCRDYITEKFFVNALQNDVIPIVMGAHPDDYRRVAPHHSYIHVDDFESPKQLANYLHKLANNPTLYNEYFAWKHTGQFINTHSLCRMCAAVHNARHKNIRDLGRWWEMNGQACVNGNTWRNGTAAGVAAAF